MSVSEGISIYGSCKENLPIDGDMAVCRLCQTGYHFGDRSMKSNSWRSLGKNGQGRWTCQSCRQKSRNNSQSQEDETPSHDLSLKIDKLLELVPTVNQIKTTIDFLSAKYDELIEEIKGLRKENKELKDEVKEVKTRLKTSEDNVTSLTNRLNDLEQYGRRVNLEIHGVSVCGPKLEDENTTAVVEELGKQIGVNFSKDDIHKLHRLQKRSDGKPPAILVQFMSSEKRDVWLRAGKKAKLQEKSSGNNIYFNENLTYFFEGLLREAKGRAKVHGYRFVWYQNGKVLV